MAVTYVRGDRKLVTFPVTAGTTFAKGELLAVASNAVKSFTTLSDVGTKAQNQAAARDAFAGVANVAVTSGSPASIQVATAGTFTFDCASATFNVGDMVTPIGTGAADAVGVSATSVEVTTNQSLAIGRVVKKYASATTRVQVEIFGVYMGRPADDVVAVDTISESTSAAGVTIDGVLLKDAGVTATGTTVLGGTNAASIKGIYYSGTFAVAVPTIANDAAENADSVTVDLSSLTFAPAVGDAVIAVPLEALPTDCLLCGSYVTATDTVTVTFASKEGGGGVTGANKNFGFVIIDLT